MSRILFFCYHNDARSQMAEALARAHAKGDIVVASAGVEQGKLNPMTRRVMGEIGIDLGGQCAKTLEDLPKTDFDVVITLCDDAAKALPLLPGRPECVNWALPDPCAVEGEEETVLATFRQSRDHIRELVTSFFDRGYLQSLMAAREKEMMLLDSITDGIIVHDLKRHIYHFNKAAEQITGYLRREVLSRDCHDVFPGNFCGGKCAFCDDVPQVDGTVEREIEICTRSGETRTVALSVRPFTNARGEDAGVLVVFHDVTDERRLQRRFGEIRQYSGIIGQDAKMLDVFDLVREVADCQVPVLVQGESGTGKELVAAAIHNEGQRAARLFVPVNCGALPETLLESELFGHVKGAFTGAFRDKKGRFELADGGTIFLDEIGDISPAMQVRLLRVLQEGTFERVGGEKTFKVDVRVISATNKTLTREIAEGRFREDLYYRLNVVPIFLPPLRERRNDIPLLVDHILKHALKQLGRTDITLSPETLDIMMSYDWPGNVRELQNWIQFALVKCRAGAIGPEHLPPQRDGIQPAAGRKRRRRKLELSAVRRALDETGGNKVEAAKLLEVSRATLYRFLEDAGL